MKTSNQQNSISQSLLKIGIDLSKIQPYNFPSKEISVLNKSLGVTKSFGNKNQHFWKFNEIEINEFITGKYVILFSLYPANITDMEEIVNTLFKDFGDDSSMREIFLPYEKYIFNEEIFSSNPTRQWLDSVDYEVDLTGYLKTQTIVLTLLEKE